MSWAAQTTAGGGKAETKPVTGESTAAAVPTAGAGGSGAGTGVFSDCFPSFASRLEGVAERCLVACLSCDDC